MKGSILLVAAAAAGASASAHRHAHRMFAKRGTDAEVCVPSCTTVYTTIYGEATLVPKPPSPETSSIPPPPSSAVPEAPTSTFVPPVDLPTDAPELCPTPGEYTFPATTITVSETTTVCAPATTKLPEGTQTYGGITTVVDYETTIVVPYPTEQTNNGVVTSVIETTTFVCPEPGTYTVAPTTTVCVEETVVVYPTITTVVPGTYTRPAVTTTITQTNVIVVCPWTTKEPALAAPTSPASQPVPEPEPTYAPEPEPTYAPEPEPEEPGNGGDIGGGAGDHWAITYTPYSEDASGSCKSATQVDSDIKRISEAGFTVVRIYSTDCDTLQNVGGAAEKYGLHLIIGIFVKDTCDPNARDIKEQVNAIVEWANWAITDLVVVGNECIFQGRCDAASLKQLIVSVKEALNGAGYTGPYTTAETLNVWEQPQVASALCSVIDIVGGQVHPYFNADVSPSEAGQFVQNQLDILQNDICGLKPALNLECGWPTAGVPNGRAIPGQQEQREAIRSIRELVGDKTVFFSFHDDGWKDPGSCQCEQHWGSRLPLIVLVLSSVLTDLLVCCSVLASLVFLRPSLVLIIPLVISEDRKGRLFVVWHGLGQGHPLLLVLFEQNFSPSSIFEPRHRHHFALGIYSIIGVHYISLSRHPSLLSDWQYVRTAVVVHKSFYTKKFTYHQEISRTSNLSLALHNMEKRHLPNYREFCWKASSSMAVEPSSSQNTMNAPLLSNEMK
ncbi:glycoside hydrolase [Sodiomyces alkalinus F11]|uniref:Probable beta-glucosidase btgE n=1 Tax=Sodiomyces alkalinus (strain CBS 110278 / VKM F-3762 / F11) TaxID=1314773 RepID=A0A3N2PYV9_SODAK|nr:glycoside hydrolase [Sodiomyces alkalinus F11]ROT39711.1 glycoside hydrolase [Sodiomyces alkalinus F11]